MTFFAQDTSIRGVARAYARGDYLGAVDRLEALLPRDLEAAGWHLLIVGVQVYYGALKYARKRASALKDDFKWERSSWQMQSDELLDKVKQCMDHLWSKREEAGYPIAAFALRANFFEKETWFYGFVHEARKAGRERAFPGQHPVLANDARRLDLLFP